MQNKSTYDYIYRVKSDIHVTVPTNGTTEWVSDLFTIKKFKINNTSYQNRQFELFGSNVNTSINFQQTNNLKIERDIITEWRDRIYNHQFKISKDSHNKTLHQTNLPINIISNERKIDPFSLQPLSLNFWRTNQFIHNGPAMYFVIDSMENSKIILWFIFFQN